MTTAQLFDGKAVDFFSLHGAYTPICSSSHQPRFNELASTLKVNGRGVDNIICMSVSDAFVMNEWGKAQEFENITLMPDGNGKFAEGMGMLVNKNALGFGKL